jgi:uncharacterized membrane protein YfcA
VAIATGAAGAALGSLLGKTFDGRQLLFLFAILMSVVGVLDATSRPPRQLTKVRRAAIGEPAQSVFLVMFVAFVVGMLSGFFRIGGGFLTVPGLLLSTGIATIYAVGLFAPCSWKFWSHNGR